MVEQFIIDGLVELYPNRRVAVLEGAAAMSPSNEVVKVVSHDKIVYDVKVSVTSTTVGIHSYSRQASTLYG
ncbi:hypothetical protein VPHD528_0069 [Vibrio phage D528]